jgi:hypothetical protein
MYKQHGGGRSDMDTMPYITLVRLFQPFPQQWVHCLLGLTNLTDSPGDLSFILETVSNVSQGSEPQSTLKFPGTISCDSHNFHLLVTWESKENVQALSKPLLSEYFPDTSRPIAQMLSLN